MTQSHDWSDFIDHVGNILVTRDFDDYLNIPTTVNNSFLFTKVISFLKLFSDCNKSKN